MSSMIEQLLERSTQQKRQQDQTDKEKQTNGWRQSDSDSHTLYEKIDEDEDEIKLEEQRQAHDPQEEQAHIEDETEPARRTILQLYENLFFCEYLLFFLDCAILYISGTITAAHPPPILLAAGLISLIASSIQFLRPLFLSFHPKTKTNPHPNTRTIIILAASSTLWVVAVALAFGSYAYVWSHVEAFEGRIEKRKNIAGQPLPAERFISCGSVSAVLLAASLWQWWRIYQLYTGKYASIDDCAAAFNNRKQTRS